MEPTSPPAWLAFVPLLTLGLIPAAVAAWIAPRKGKSRPLFFLLAFPPILGPVILVWLVSLTDADVLGRLAALEAKDKRQSEGSQPR